MSYVRQDESIIVKLEKKNVFNGLQKKDFITNLALGKGKTRKKISYPQLKPFNNIN